MRKYYISQLHLQLLTTAIWQKEFSTGYREKQTGIDNSLSVMLAFLLLPWMMLQREHSLELPRTFD